MVSGPVPCSSIWSRAPLIILCGMPPSSQTLEGKARSTEACKESRRQRSTEASSVPGPDAHTARRPPAEGSRAATTGPSTSLGSSLVLVLGKARERRRPARRLGWVHPSDQFSGSGRRLRRIRRFRFAHPAYRFLEKLESGYDGFLGFVLLTPRTGSRGRLSVLGAGGALSLRAAASAWRL